MGFFAGKGIKALFMGLGMDERSATRCGRIGGLMVSIVSGDILSIMVDGIGSGPLDGIDFWPLDGFGGEDCPYAGPDTTAG
jgi:hypothetical protein